MALQQIQRNGVMLPLNAYTGFLCHGRKFCVTSVSANSYSLRINYRENRRYKHIVLQTPCDQHTSLVQSSRGAKNYTDFGHKRKSPWTKAKIQLAVTLGALFSVWYITDTYVLLLLFHNAYFDICICLVHLISTVRKLSVNC